MTGTMQYIEYSSELRLQPQFKRVLLMAIWLEALFLPFVSGLWLWRTFFWHEYPPLFNTPLRAIAGVVVESALIVGMAFVDFAFRRPNCWLASSTGIEVYVGRRLRMQIPWSQVTAITLKPFRITCRYHSDRTRVSNMYWTNPADGNKLRQMWCRSVGSPLS